MFAERKNVRQIPGEGFRRWFSDEYFDLIVWYRDERRGDAGDMAGFQLCYDKEGQERALSWRREGGFSHDLVDTGEIPGRSKMSPVLQAGGELSEMMSERFRSSSLEMEPLIVSLVCEKLEEYQEHRHRGSPGGDRRHRVAPAVSRQSQAQIGSPPRQRCRR